MSHGSQVCHIPIASTVIISLHEKGRKMDKYCFKQNYITYDCDKLLTQIVPGADIHLLQIAQAHTKLNKPAIKQKFSHSKRQIGYQPTDRPTYRPTDRPTKARHKVMQHATEILDILHIQNFEGQLP